MEFLTQDLVSKKRLIVDQKGEGGVAQMVIQNSADNEGHWETLV